MPSGLRSGFGGEGAATESANFSIACCFSGDCLRTLSKIASSIPYLRCVSKAGRAA